MPERGPATSPPARSGCAQHGHLLDRDGPVADRRARARGGRVELLRHVGPFSAFTIAFQVPNLLRALVADSALSAAFVPVFTELLEQKKRKDAFQLAGALFGLILVVLGAITLRLHPDRAGA